MEEEKVYEHCQHLLSIPTILVRTVVLIRYRADLVIVMRRSGTYT